MAYRGCQPNQLAAFAVSPAFVPIKTIGEFRNWKSRGPGLPKGYAWLHTLCMAPYDGCSRPNCVLGMFT